MPKYKFSDIAYNVTDKKIDAGYKVNCFVEKPK